LKAIPASVKAALARLERKTQKRQEIAVVRFATEDFETNMEKRVGKLWNRREWIRTGSKGSRTWRRRQLDTKRGVSSDHGAGSGSRKMQNVLEIVVF
jgi:hypothetical protein